MSRVGRRQVRKSLPYLSKDLESLCSQSATGRGVISDNGPNAGEDTPEAGDRELPV